MFDYRLGDDVSTNSCPHIWCCATRILGENLYFTATGVSVTRLTTSHKSIYTVYDPMSVNFENL